MIFLKLLLKESACSTKRPAKAFQSLRLEKKLYIFLKQCEKNMVCFRDNQSYKGWNHGTRDHPSKWYDYVAVTEMKTN